MEVCGRVTCIRKTRFAWFVDITGKITWQLLIERTQKQLKNQAIIGSIIIAAGDIDSFSGNTIIVKNITVIRHAPIQNALDKDLIFFSSKLKKLFCSMLDELEFNFVDLPILMRAPSSSKAKSFYTKYSVNNETLYLRKSFDVLMRILSAYDFDLIYTYGHCFRNEHITQKNQPEFEMLSIYANYYTCDDLEKLIKKLLLVVLESTECTYSSLSFKEYCIKYKEHEAISSGEIVIVSGFPYNTKSNAKYDKEEHSMREIKFISNVGTICHIIEEIDSPDDLETLFKVQGINEHHAENRLLLDCLKSGVPPCTSAGISLVRLAAFINNNGNQLKKYDAFPFSRMRTYK